MRHLFAFLPLFVGLSSLSHPLLADDAIRAVGSSTVYPFITVVAEEFGKKTGNKTPIIESTGTGGGFKLFCAGNGPQTPTIANASRPIKDSEIALCKQNNVEKPLEINIGSDGLVFAHSIKAPQYALTPKYIFLALARLVPLHGKLIDNPYKKWSDIDASLPSARIEVYGPPPTSGTRDSFVELVMDKECEKLDEFRAAYPDDKARAKACKLLREDGAFIEAGENDNLIIQKLNNNPTALGIFGYSFLEENSELVQGSLINGIAPDFDSIMKKKYPIARPLFVYIKNQHMENVAVKAFVNELLSDTAIGDEGYLATKGLIPLSKDERTALRETINPSPKKDPETRFNNNYPYPQSKEENTAPKDYNLYQH